MSATLNDKNMRVTGSAAGSFTLSKSTSECGSDSVEESSSPHLKISDICQEKSVTADGGNVLPQENSSGNRELHTDITHDFGIGKLPDNQISAKNSTRSLAKATDNSLGRTENNSEEQNEIIQIVSNEAHDLKTEIELKKVENENLSGSDLSFGVSVTICPSSLSSRSVPISVACTTSTTPNGVSLMTHNDIPGCQADSENSQFCYTSIQSEHLKKDMKNNNCLDSVEDDEMDIICKNGRTAETMSCEPNKQENMNPSGKDGNSKKESFNANLMSKNCDMTELGEKIEILMDVNVKEEYRKSDVQIYGDIDEEKEDSHSVKQKGGMEHLIRRHENNNFPCQHCDSTFTTSSQLLSHQKNHSDQIPFECLVCGCNFKDVELLNQHMLTHTNFKQISCNFCDYVCKNQRQLDVHTDTHKHRRFFQESEFRRETNTVFQQHTQRHKWKALHSCSICSVICKSQVELQQHILAHANQKAFSCEHCDFQCETKPELNSHLLIHTEINPFICPFCEFSCRSKPVLIKHTITHMNDDDEDVNSEVVNKTVRPSAKLEVPKNQGKVKKHCHLKKAAFRTEKAPTGKTNCSDSKRPPKTPEKSNLISSLKSTAAKKTEPSSGLRRSTRNRKARIRLNYCESDTSGHIDAVAKQEIESGDEDVEGDGVDSVDDRLDKKPSSSGFDPIEEALIEGKIPNPNVINKTDSDDWSLKGITATTDNYFYQPESHRFYCTHCQYTCETIAYLKRHMKTHTDLKFQSCPHCEYFCKTEDQLKEHMVKHSEEGAEVRPFPCDQCGFRSKTQGDLKRHVMTHLEVKPFACALCCYRCTRKSRLSEHMRIHSNVKPFSCAVCKYQCRSRQNLNSHMKRHMKRKHHLCPHCDFRSLTKPLLKKHLQQDHPDRRPYACDICSFTCWLRSDLKKHEWIHAGIKPFECEECDYKCRRINRLREHMLIHKNVKPYKCKKCSYATRTKHYLSKHIDENHQEKHIKSKSIKSKASEGFVLRLRSGDKPLRKIEKRNLEPENESCSPSYSKKIKVEENIDNPSVHFEKSDTGGSESVSDKDEKLVPEILTVRGKGRGQKTFHCSMCSYMSKKPSRVKRHMSCHSSARPYKCDQCDLAFKTEDDLRKHRRRQSCQSHSKKAKKEENKVTPDVIVENDDNLDSENANDMCEKNIPDIFIVNRERRGQKTFNCTVCSYVCKKLSHLKRHMYCHTTERPYKCDQCDYTSKTEDNLRRHSKRHSGIKPYSCKLCSYRCYELGDLNQHLLTHTDFRAFKCPLCDYAARKKNRLKEHLMTHSDVKPFLCSECGDSFRTSSKLREHMFRHNTAKNIQCPHCKFKCRRQSELNKHMKKHIEPKPEKDAKTQKAREPKPFLCPECGLSFKYNSALKQHMITHTDDKPFPCPHCHFHGRTKGQLKSHMTKHLETKPLACEYCPFTCKHESSLRRHRLIHTCTEPLQCQFCDFTCVRSYDIKRHMQNKHKLDSAKAPMNHPNKQIQLGNNCNQSSDNVVFVPVVEITDNSFDKPVEFEDRQMEFDNKQMEFTAGKSMDYSFAAKPVDYIQSSKLMDFTSGKAVAYSLPRSMDYGAGKAMDYSAVKLMDNNAGKSMMDYTSGKSMDYSSGKNYALKQMDYGNRQMDYVGRVMDYPSKSMNFTEKPQDNMGRQMDYTIKHL